MEVQKRLTMEGCIVISVGLFGHSGDEEVWKPGTKEMLDDMHLRKIDMADEILSSMSAATLVRVPEAKAKEEGVKALPKGIYYKVLSEGNQDSAKPTVRSIITAHYTGKTIDGKQFDSSRGGVPLACRLCNLIEGWIIAMQQMHIGDKWELYIPAEMGYGKFSQPGIPGGSTLIFEIELLGIA